jgi:hypothetical protein
MAIRFAPFARIRVLSLAVELLKDPENAIKNFSDKLQTLPGTQLEVDPTSVDENLFTDIGLATEISITQTFNTRAQYGIGEPANPTIVPGNLSLRVTMSRLTTDSKQMADYITSPTFYYSNIMQRLGVLYGSSFSSINNIDALFYTYLHVGSIETFKSTQLLDPLTTYQNYELIAFMPNSFTKRLSAQNAEVVTDVEGEGKLFNLSSLYQIFNALDNADVEGITTEQLPPQPVTGAI